jgi:hypothetical protein
LQPGFFVAVRHCRSRDTGEIRIDRPSRRRFIMNFVLDRTIAGAICPGFVKSARID